MKTRELLQNDQQRAMTERFYKLTQDLLVALSAAKDASRAILDIYDQDFKISYKDDHSPLTRADRRSHDIIVSHLSDAFGKRLPILSEEGKEIPFGQRRTWEYFWLIDPLDGTKEFIKRNGEFTVNIALIHQNRPILGVIYVPVKDTVYFAAEGLGAYRMDRGDMSAFKTPGSFKGDPDGLIKTMLKDSVKLTDQGKCLENQDSHITIVGSRSHPTKELDAFIETMRKNHGDVAFISAGSSLKLCLVAEGRADIYPRLGPTMEWDTAAGQAIVEQAEGSVLNFETRKPLEYNKENLLNPWFVASRKMVANTKKGLRCDS